MPISVQWWWGWRICWKQHLMLLWDEWGSRLNSAVLCVGVFKMMQCFEYHSPVVASEVILNLVCVKLCRSMPLLEGKVTSTWDVVSTGVHAITLLYLDKIQKVGHRKGAITYSCGCEGQGTNWMTSITRIGGGNFWLYPMGGEVDQQCSEDRLRLEWTLLFLAELH